MLAGETKGHLLTRVAGCSRVLLDPEQGDIVLQGVGIVRSRGHFGNSVTAEGVFLAEIPGARHHPHVLHAGER